MQLFGTDGIRGEISESQSDDSGAIASLTENRQVSPRLFRLIGEGIGATLSSDNEVVIGWDPRPRNHEFVQCLTQGLHLRGVKVTWAGEVATPGLQASMLSRDASLGCMVTASHNPVSDTGIKIFDSNGFKTMPEYEFQICDIINKLSSEEREIDQPELVRISTPDHEIDGSQLHFEMLEKRFEQIDLCFAKGIKEFNIPSNGIAIDTSGGTAKKWLVDWLNLKGIPAYSAGNPDKLNENCGAGGLSPTDEWTWDNLGKPIDHLLISRLAEKCTNGMPVGWNHGDIVGAALDGDGDRCLLIETTEQGLRVIDGDRMADAIIRSGGEHWELAASIETDLGLEVDYQTAVGDRWLSAALSPNLNLLSCEKMPTLVGSEDSGHLVLAAPHPILEGNWSLVGDGIATLLASLSAFKGLSGKSNSHFKRGWKRRVSVRGVDRKRWDGVNDNAIIIEQLVHQAVNNWGDVGEWRNSDISGETSLLLLETTVDGHPFSLGVRNSGTEQKTNASIRLSPKIAHLSKNALELLNMIEEELFSRLKN